MAVPGRARQSGGGISNVTGFVHKEPANHDGTRCGEGVGREADLLDEPAVAAVPHTTAFFVDQLGPISNPVNAPVLEVPQGQALTIAGWALDTGRRRPAAAVDLVLDGARYRAPVRLARADVATAYGDQAYSRCGFNTRLPARAISPGPHSLDLRVVAAGGESYPAVCLRFEAV